MIQVYAFPMREEPAPQPLGKVQVLTPAGPRWVACYGAQDWRPAWRSPASWWLDHPVGSGPRRWDIVRFDGRVVRIGTGTASIASPGQAATFVVLPFLLEGEAVGDGPLFHFPLLAGGGWPVWGFGPGYLLDQEGATWLIARRTRYRLLLARQGGSGVR